MAIKKVQSAKYFPAQAHGFNELAAIEWANARDDMLPAGWNLYGDWARVYNTAERFFSETITPKYGIRPASLPVPGSMTNLRDTFVTTVAEAEQNASLETERHMRRWCLNFNVQKSRVLNPERGPDGLVLVDWPTARPGGQ